MSSETDSLILSIRAFQATLDRLQNLGYSYSQAYQAALEA